MKLSPAWIIIAFLLVILGLSLSSTLVHLLTEIWWFDTVGFTQVFWTRLTWQILLWALTFVVYALFLWGNYWLATRGKPQRNLYLVVNSSWEVDSKKTVNYVALFAIAMVALIAAFSMVSSWETVLKYLHSSSFGSSEPILGQDLGFYSQIK